MVEELRSKLFSLPDDKSQITVLLDTISDAALLEDKDARIQITSYATGYLGSLLRWYDLGNDKHGLTGG